MKRADLAHILRAAQALTNEREFVLVGSQAALVGLAGLPPEMVRSMVLDIYPRKRPELAELIEGSIGEGSMFHETYGYYAQGVAPETAKLPRDWEARALSLSNAMTDQAVGIAPEIHDICASKLAAFREKDRDYVAAALAARLVRARTLRERFAAIPDLDPAVRSQASAWLDGNDPEVTKDAARRGE